MDIRPYVPQCIKSLFKSNPLVEGFVRKLFNIQIAAEYTDVSSLITLDEGRLLTGLAEQVTSGDIVEIGCYSGASAYFLGIGAKKSGSHIYSIDPFDSMKDRQLAECDGSIYPNEKKPTMRDVQKALQTKGLDGVVTLIEGFSADVATRWDNGKIDLLWIDGNHEQVSSDYNAWQVYLQENARIAFHDYNNPQFPKVRATVNQILATNKARIQTEVDTICVLALNSTQTQQDYHA